MLRYAVWQVGIDYVSIASLDHLVTGHEVLLRKVRAPWRGAGESVTTPPVQPSSELSLLRPANPTCDV